MNITITDTIDDFNYPDEQESMAAVRACCGRCCTACESPAEYAWRKRNVDMAALLSIAIERELTDRERSVIEDYYFVHMKTGEISQKEGLDRTTVTAARKRAEDKLRRALAYVYMYQHDCITQPDEKLCLGNSFAILEAARNSGKSVGARLRSRRIAMAHSLAKVSEATGIDPLRLSEIENDRAVPDGTEEELIMSAYQMTKDELFNERGGKNGNNDL